MARPQTTDAAHPRSPDEAREPEPGRDYFDPDDATSPAPERGVERHREDAEGADEEELADEDLQDRELDEDLDAREGDGPDA